MELKVLEMEEKLSASSLRLKLILRAGAARIFSFSPISG